MKILEPCISWIYYTLFYFIAHVLTRTSVAHACSFPDYLQWQEGDTDFKWHTGIRHDGSREWAYSVSHNLIEITHPSSDEKPVRWRCSMSFHGKFLLKRRDPLTLHYSSACVKFIRRSKSIVQMMWSKESGRLDPVLCEDRNLHLDPWLLVSYSRLMEDYAPSPFRGGFSMRITDSASGENGCNYMHRPMKFESDCLTGEGVMLDFISENCLPPSVPMSVKQRTLPVTSWMHKGNHYIVLRRRDVLDLFCLRVPVTGDNHMNAYLFSDLACLADSPSALFGVPPPLKGVRYLVLHLHRYVYRHLCDDEYPQCSAVSCDSYVRHECHKSCKVCDVDNPPATCTFPRRVRGNWFQTDKNGFSRVHINETDFTIDNLGSFRCAVFPDSPSRRTRMHTTVSMFDNGCRPRYTCVRFKRLGPSVLRYTVSRSFVWPELEDNFGKSICSHGQFGTDPEPINDLYRSHEDTGKPIISDKPAAQPVACNMSSSFTITATLPNGSLCHGSLFEHCEDNTRLRLQLHAGCGQVVTSGDTVISPYMAESSSFPGPSFTDYSCLAHFEGHYWEKMLMLQNVGNPKDARCLLFSQLDASAALVMVAGQCDKNSWNYARTGVRTPLLSLQLRQDEFPCKYLPVVSTPHTALVGVVGGDGGFNGSGVGMRTLRNPHSSGSVTRVPSVPFAVTFPPGPDHRSSADYEKPKGDRTSIDYNPVLSPAGKEPASGESSVAPGIVLAFPSAALLLTICLDWINR